MAIVKVHKKASYTIMPNGFLRQKDMSYKAKGILAVMLSLPENWDYSIAGLATLSRDGRDSVNAALQELEKLGYLVRTKASDSSRAGSEMRELLDPIPLTDMLIKGGYIARDDPYIPEYNSFLAKAYKQCGFKRVRDCTSYFLSKAKELQDQGLIQDRLRYFKAAMAANLERTSPAYKEEEYRRLHPKEYAAEVEKIRKEMTDIQDSLYGKQQDEITEE